MIVFGHNNFRMRKYTPSELGLPASYDNYTIEIRQRYAHIFWIPLFPIGKIWGLRNHADNKLYEMPAEVRQAVQQQKKVPMVSVWAFSGFLLAAVIGIVAVIGNYFQEMHFQSMARDFFKADYEAKMVIVKDPKPGDVYELRNSDYESVKFMVDSVAPGKIELRSTGDTKIYPEFWLQCADIQKYMKKEFGDDNFAGADLPGIEKGPYTLSELQRGEYVVEKNDSTQARGATEAHEK